MSKGCSDRGCKKFVRCASEIQPQKTTITQQHSRDGLPDNRSDNDAMKKDATVANGELSVGHYFARGLVASRYYSTTISLK